MTADGAQLIMQTPRVERKAPHPRLAREQKRMVGVKREK